MFSRIWQLLGLTPALPTNSEPNNLENKVTSLQRIEDELHDYQDRFASLKKNFVNYKCQLREASDKILPIYESKTLQTAPVGNSWQAKKLEEKLENILNRHKTVIVPLNEQLAKLREEKQHLELCDVANDLAEKMDEIIVEINEAILHSRDKKEVQQNIIRFILINLCHIPDVFTKDFADRDNASLYLAIRAEVEKTEKIFSGIFSNLQTINHYLQKVIEQAPKDTTNAAVVPEAKETADAPSIQNANKAAAAHAATNATTDTIAGRIKTTANTGNQATPSTRENGAPLLSANPSTQWSKGKGSNTASQDDHKANKKDAASQTEHQLSF